MVICRPFVASVSRRELVVAFVVSVGATIVMEPVFFTSTARATVSPAARPLAPTLSRLFAPLVPIGANDTVPDDDQRPLWLVSLRFTAVLPLGPDRSVANHVHAPDGRLH